MLLDDIEGPEPEVRMHLMAKGIDTGNACNLFGAAHIMHADAAFCRILLPLVSNELNDSLHHKACTLEHILRNNGQMRNSPPNILHDVQQHHGNNPIGLPCTCTASAACMLPCRKGRAACM